MDINENRFAILYFIFVLIIIIGSINIIPMISAEDFPTYRKDTVINITHSVRLGGFPNDNILCNITMFDPNFAMIADFRQMTYNSTFKTVNYTFNKANETGTYCYDVTCSVSSVNKTDSFCIEINPTGDNFTVQQSIIYLFVLFLSLGLLGLFLFWSITIPWKNERSMEGQIVKINHKKFIKLFFMAMSYVMILWIAYVTWSITLAYIYFTPIPFFFRFIWKSMLSFLLPIVTVFVIVGFIVWVQDLKLEKLAERGIYDWKP